jgi:hypothetical protein
MAGSGMDTLFVGQDFHKLSESKLGYGSEELICLGAREGTDAFSTWLVNRGALIYWKLWNYVPRLPLVSTLLRWVRPPKRTEIATGPRRPYAVIKLTLWTTSVMASVVPIIAIVVLVKLSALNARLLMIAALNILVSMCITIFTEAKKSEVFAITGAYVPSYARSCRIIFVTH